MAQDDLRFISTKTRNDSEETTRTQALLAHFWREISRFVVPPVVAGALLLGACDSDCPNHAPDAADVADVEVPEDLEPSWIDGRPFIVDGAIRRSCMEAGEGWSLSDAVDVQGLTAHQRDVLSAHWTRVAQGEHASIAAFGRFTLELLHLGAPEELLTQTADALKDEVRHTQMALSMAAAYSGHPVAPGPLDISDSMNSATDRASILKGTIVGGCINETLAVAQLRTAADRAEIPGVRGLLEELAADESRHAALAWQTASWMLQKWPSLHSTAVEAFEQAAFQAPTTHETTDATLEGHGYLTTEQQNAVLEHTMETVIASCKETLLANPS